MTDEMLAKIKSCTSLPTLPAIAMQVLELTQKEEVDLSEIAKTITKDPALAGKILKTVNSSFYGRSHAVGTVSHALVILGLQAVKTLVLGFSLVTSLSKDRNKGFDHMRYWRRSIYAATAARVISTKIGCVQQEEAFLSTLLADVGVLVFNKVLGEQYDDVYKTSDSHAALTDRELQTLGATHAEVGGYLAESWKLPPVLVVPIRCHHSPIDAGDPSLIRLAEIVGLAGRCADVFVDKLPIEAIAEVRLQLQSAFNIGNEAEADAMLAEINTKTREIATLFEINLGSPIDFAAILKQANETLIDLTLQSQMRATQLTEQNEILKVKATTDRLTGLSNRATLDDFLTEQFAKALSERIPLSLIMLDIDKFKSVNDTYGHQAGDAVLTAIGSLMKELARESDMAARYGGEELVLILPGTTRAVAAGIAETLRRAIGGRSIISETITLRVTASLGVATLEPLSPFTQPAHLLKAADLAVYRAKHSGRNNVKVFALSPGATKAA